MIPSLSASSENFCPKFSTRLSNLKPPKKHSAQAVDAGRTIRKILDSYHYGEPYNLFFYISPYTRSLQTYLGIRSAFPDDRIVGVQEEVQLREQVNIKTKGESK